jgi:diguanylate cyclase (GGDEF)-like protein
MLRMDQALLRVALDQLEDAFDHQAQWHANVLRAVFCRIPPDPGDLDPFSYRNCYFGRWYYERAPAELRAQDSFGAIGREHERMHRIAGRLLREVNIDTPVVRADFEDFIATSGRLRLQFDALKDTVQAALTNRDVLTGACGRIGMLPELREQHARAQHGGEPCCLVFVDIDNLKQINDKYGHQVGDHVLTAAVQFVNEHLRTRDRVFRYGGDEFLICLPGADLETGQRVVGRIREGLAQKLLVRGPDNVGLPVTASFGLAQLDPDSPIMESVDRADQALLLAKTAGRNKAISWDRSITTGTQWRPLQCGDAS